jgi:hypothetical protein
MSSDGGHHCEKERRGCDRPKSNLSLLGSLNFLFGPWTLDFFLGISHRTGV